MNTPTFDHERLDVYRLSIDCVAFSYRIAKTLSGVNRPARDQWLRAAQSIPLNIAEGNGKRSRKVRARFWFMRRLVVVTCSILLPIAVYAFWSQWGSSHARASGAQNLHQIGLALHNYHAAYKTFPPAFLNGHSWRIRCSPFVISSPLFMHYDFDAPWDSAENMTIHCRPLRTGKGPDPDALVVVFGMPSFFQSTVDLPYQTSFLMLVGDRAFSGHEHGRTMNDITDPLECTIAVAETSRRDIHWLHPLDFDVNELSLAINSGPASISSDDPLGPLVLFADGGVFRLNPKIDADTLRALITIDGNEDVSRDRLLARRLLIEP